MKYVCEIRGLGGSVEVEFDTEEQAYDYGAAFVLERDWTASYEVKEVRE